MADGKVVNRQSKMNFINGDCLSYEEILQPLLIANVCRFNSPDSDPIKLSSPSLVSSSLFNG